MRVGLKEPYYALRTNSFSIAHFLNKLQSERKVEALVHILYIHTKTDNKLIKEILDEEENDLTPLIALVDRQQVLVLSRKRIELI